MTLKRILALVLSVIIMASAAIITTSAADNGETGITVHYYTESSAPTVYYWNSLPKNIEIEYPGTAMKKDTEMGDNWYKYTFDNATFPD